jgi:hypothetical protein
VRVKALESAARRKLVVRECVLSVELTRVQTEASHAVRMPPEAPIDGRVAQVESRLGRKVFLLDGSRIDNLVSWRETTEGR